MKKFALGLLAVALVTPMIGCEPATTPATPSTTPPAETAPADESTTPAAETPAAETPAETPAE